MDINLEILSWAISDAINNSIKGIHLNPDNIVNSVSLMALTEIKEILNDDTIIDDFEIVEEIVNIFEKYNISTGNRHDFG